jgi:hypothetical protein
MHSAWVSRVSVSRVSVLPKVLCDIEGNVTRASVTRARDNFWPRDRPEAPRVWLSAQARLQRVRAWGKGQTASGWSGAHGIGSD